MTTETLAEAPAASLPLDLASARAAYTRAVRFYAAERRLMVEDFAKRSFALKGALELHRRALGHDLWRAPANIALAVPFLAAKGSAAAARRIGWQGAALWLGRHKIFLTTDVAREVEWRLMTELLQLPYSQGERVSHRDALAEVMLADPRVAGTLNSLARHLAERSQDPAFRAWMSDTLSAYTGSRVAAADLTNALLATATGALTFHQLTPGAMSLGPLLAQALSAKLAIGTFPLGAGLGSLFFGAFPATAPAMFTAGVTAGLVGLGALLATFSGVLTDPLQRRLGLHQRRLLRLIDALEHELIEEKSGRFQVRDHYAARLLDLLDLAATLKRG